MNKYLAGGIKNINADFSEWMSEYDATNQADALIQAGFNVAIEYGEEGSGMARVITLDTDTDIDKSKITIGILSGSEGKLFIESISKEMIDIEYNGNIDEYVLEKYGSTVNWQEIDPEIHTSKKSNLKLMKTLGKKLTESKVKIGDIVEFEGNKYKVTSESYTSHPEYLIGGRRAREGFYVQLFPIDEGVEEPSGWINQHRIKVIKK